LEKEFSNPNYMYWILQGEIYFYKKLEDLYYDNGTDLVDADIEPIGQITEFKKFG